MTDEEQIILTENERILLDLLVRINAFESRCKTLHASTAVPAVVYELIADLRNAIADWGTINLVEERLSEKALARQTEK